MAAPRSLRPFLAPAKRVKISPPRASAQTFLRCNSSGGDRPSPRSRPKRPRKNFDKEAYYEEILKGDKPIEDRLKELGIDPEEYETLRQSSEKADAKFKKWMPKSKEEAQRKWKQMVDTPDNYNMLHMFKREGVDVLHEAKARGMRLPTDEPPLDPRTKEALDALRTPINVRAVHLRPFRRAPEVGIPVCDLQLRTYSVRGLLLFSDFAVRAAYYMGLPARGPVPLPRITERWTVPRANFIFKKSQENFERITLRRLIQIQDGHPDVVKAWLAFLQKHAYHGIGMKANIYEFESLESACRAGYDLEQSDFSRRREGPMLEKVNEILAGKGYKEAMRKYEVPQEVELRP